MNQHRRWTALLALGSAAALMISGCSTAGGGSSSGGGGDKTVITFGTTDDPAVNEAEQEIIDNFTAENPDITVQFEKVAFADYDTKLTTELRAGTGPDVFRVNHPNVQLWAGAGYLADLTDAMADIDTSNFVPGLLSIGGVDGTFYALPIDTGNRALWYNPKLLESVGVTEPPSTWAELLDTVGKFKDNADVYGYCFVTNSDYAMAYETVGPYMAQAGGVILSDATPAQAIAATEEATVAAVTLLQDIAKTGEIPPGSANMDGDTRSALFAGGQCALMIGGTWERPVIEADNPDAVFGEDYAVAVVPTREAGQESGTTGGGWMLGVNAESKQAEAAAKFFAFYAKSESLMLLSGSDTFPPLLDGMDGEPYAGDPFFEPFREMLPNTVLPIVPVPQMAEVSAEFEAAVRGAVNDGKDVVTQLTNFDTKVNEQVLTQ